MNSRTATIVLLVALAFSAMALSPKFGALHLPGNQQGYEPAQPIDFSHRLHAGELQIACLYCHSGAEKSRYAGVPAASVCMNCHRFVTAPLGAVRAEDELAKKELRAPRKIVSPQLAKLYAALGLGDDMRPSAAHPPRPIEWVRIHNLPDFAHFDHRAHVTAGVTCQTCHGAVETMERVRQIPDLSMGWCVNCHRTANQTGIAGKAVQASVDCSVCHF
ncbi:MAG: cytochrome c3 family protein [Terriglobia bacterium]